MRTALGDNARDQAGSPSSQLMFPLFLPATRLDRLDKARRSGATCVILDLEDAVAPKDKPEARAKLAALSVRGGGVPVYVRINAADTPWFQKDWQAAKQCGAAGVVLPKAEEVAVAASLRQDLGPGTAILGLVETARGIGSVRQLAPSFDRLFFGSLDYAADLDCAHTAPALAHARAEMVLAARLAGRPGPVDGVTTDTQDSDLIQAEAAHGADLGFKGKLLIHPKQVVAAKQGYRPSQAELDWATGVLQAGEQSGVSTYRGAMVDAPVIARATRVFALAAQTISTTDSTE